MKYTTKLLVILLACSAPMVEASENGAPPGITPFGVDGQSYFDLPPPGFYLLNYTGYYESDKLADKHGNNSLPGAKVKAAYNAFRLSYFPQHPIWGADWQVHEVFPTISENQFSYRGKTERKTGLTDLAVDPFGLGWKIGNTNIGFSTTFIAPTASFDQDDAVNLGKNHFTWVPQFFLTHYLPKGWGDFSFHTGYEYNWANKDGSINAVNPEGKRYKSGQVVHAEAALTHYMGNWRVGANLVAGYQVTSDKISGESTANDYLQDQLDGNKYQKLTAGLTGQYRIGGVAPITLTYSKDVRARNTSEGDSIVMRIVLPLSFF
ncbi:SphA family protein [Pseudomonas syringae group genomosp. 3]|uniref:Protein involved in meta-pathway of phenol degradation-like protein n=2 Tax=Pseudomonas syringae group genomosp. 3 TaxID=251701 RepID=A0A3M4RTB5_9PSED|nr:transporter [Pseudomonas syringae group genomosp. 3]RMO67304.1 Protein involved in meta-pathway of phenol degradation-like protein [Pseudomonas syringae pv. primulae]RMR05945.1 Protein involved in meta-pathway of phenol degradation-like protein [Pseudomonas syringae pv. primulae]